MMKYTVLLLLAVGLMAAKCTPGSSINSASPAWCKTTYMSQEMCDMDSKCNWDYSRKACKAR